MAEPKRKTSDALRTYRYLRIGMIAAVVLLATSVVLERVDQGCWQTSISAYFYTPAKSVLVGVLLAIGFAMIVIKGRNVFEDTALNFAGMFAPIVALAPTSPPKDAERCRIFLPSADELATAIDNNIWALLVTGMVCLVAGFGIAALLNRDVRAPFTEVDAGTWKTLLAAFAAVAAGVLLKATWNEFDTLAHGWAARLMFFCMFLAAMGAAHAARSHANDRGRPEAERKTQRRYTLLYVVTGLGMLSGLLALFADFGGHEVLLLEGWEILWFGLFWAVQTAERWYEPPSGSAAKVLAE